MYRSGKFPARLLRLTIAIAVLFGTFGASFGEMAFAHPGHDHDEREWVGPGGAPPPGSGTVQTTSFVRAVDGDTMETLIGSTRAGIGLIGIDAPPGNTICGLQAMGYLQGLVYGGLTLEEDPDIHFDEDDRRMYYAFTPGGDSVAAAMVAAGLATATGEGRDAGLLQTLQDEASAAKVGCFADPDANLNDYGTLHDNEVAAANLLQSTVLPEGLTQEVAVANLGFPSAFAFLPDGRILIGEKNGLVRIIKDGQTLQQPFIDIRSQVNDYWDRGLLDVAVDPDFESNGYVYLLYTFENNPAHYSGPKTGRLTRVTANGDTASLDTAVTLLGSVVGATCPSFTDDCIPSDGASHSTGGIAFGQDGSLFVTLGDGAGFNVVDPDALRAQHPDSLAGKMLRITNTGEGLPDNPFYTGNPNDNRSKIWASGFRNAFRLTVNPWNGIPYVGDVGWNTWEEINVATPGANFGWPCYEGPARQGGFEPFSDCQALYAQGTAQQPLVYWNHHGGGSSVTGGVFINNDEYPDPYRNAYVYADYVAGTITYIHVDENNNLTTEPSFFASNADGPVAFKMGPDGYLHYLAINSGQVRRIVPDTGQPPGSPEAFISDLPWISETNGWGPAERDMSNGEEFAGDGGPLSIRGKVYDKGIGVHADSEIVVNITDRCPTFTATIGVDDEVSPNGSVQFEVWGDEDLLYQSDVLDGTNDPVDIRVDLTGNSTLRLVVNDGGDGIRWDHANWANARLECEDTSPPPGDRIYVSDMEWVSETNGWGPAERDMSNGEDEAGDGQTLSIRGTTWDKGIGVHADSEIVVAVPEQCPVFSTYVGIDDEAAPNGSATFHIWGDDTLLWSSDLATGTSDAQQATVDLTGYAMLRLQVDDGGDIIDWDHANWADAQFVCAGDPGDGPQVVSTSPVAGATGIAVNTVVSATFSSDLSADSVNSNTVVLEGPDGVVPAAVAYQSSMRQVWLEPDAPLEEGTSYTVRLSGASNGILGLDGAPLFSDVTWTFTTVGVEGEPVAEILGIDPDYRFVVGDLLEFSGAGTDGDGNPIGPDGMAWQVLIHHCSAHDCHIHQLFSRSGVDSGTIDVPEHGIDPWYIEIILTVTQPDRTQARTAVDVLPHYVTVTLDSSPPGMNVSFAAIDGPAPLVRDIVAGSQVTIQAASPQGDYVFDSWSDGGSRQHNITLGTEDITLTANFIDASAPPPGETVYLSDLPWESETNGWGPAERDMSNGEDEPNDGNPITMSGVVYEKGLGVHADSEIVIDIAGLCPTFVAVIGIDDEVGENGAVTFEVWGDSTMLFQSGVMTGGMVGQEVQVDLSGHDTLRLVVDAGDSPNHDHANWADARLICEEIEPPREAAYVSDLPWESETNGWGPVERDMSNGEEFAGDGNPLTMAGIVFDKGIGTNSISEIVVDLDGLCTWFHAAIGIDDEVGAQGSVTFEVDGDDTLIYQSGVFTGSSLPEAISVDLSGRETMRLVVTDAGDGPNHDHGNWAIALLSCDPVHPGIPDPDPGTPPAGLFEAPVTYDTGTNAHGVTAHDVTGDGQPDLLVANAGSNTVSVMAGNGDGTFSAPVNHDVGGLAPKMVTVGDVNNDGIPDLLTANQDTSGVGVLLGTGGGSFATATQFTACNRTHEVALGDTNGDGNLDVVVACWNDDHISVHHGNGDGTFGSANRYYVGGISHSVQFADFNGDGTLDIVVDNYWGNQVHVFTGNGDGTFAPNTGYAVGSNPHGVRVGDVNGDGNLDIVTANEHSGNVSVLLGNGDGTFQPQSQYAVNPGPKGLAIGDVTGDGVPDIVVANQWGNYNASTHVPTDISVLQGNGDGTFAAADHYAIDMTPFAVTIADFNGDGRNDVAVALWHSNNTAVFLNAGD